MVTYFPSKNIGLLMDDRSFQNRIGLRLSCQLYRYFTCACGEVEDEQGLKPLSRSKISGRYFRQNEL